jgi:hypothetical protein
VARQARPCGFVNRFDDWEDVERAPRARQRFERPAIFGYPVAARSSIRQLPDRFPTKAPRTTALAAPGRRQRRDSVIIGNRGGAGGTIGSTAVARAAPDGSTLMTGHIGTLGVNPSLYRNLSYDTLTSFDYVAALGLMPNLLVVHPSLPFKTVEDLIDYAPRQSKQAQLCDRWIRQRGRHRDGGVQWDIVAAGVNANVPDGVPEAWVTRGVVALWVLLFSLGPARFCGWAWCCWWRRIERQAVIDRVSYPRFHPGGKLPMVLPGGLPPTRPTPSTL